jgi:hypothetical protein
MAAKSKQHLVGAYGLFWDRAAVDWQPGHGKTWQMLGRIGEKPPKLQVCDFRGARGFYILFNDYGPVYTGIARGRHGLGARLVKHTMNHLKDSWTRYCWFSFDDVTPTSAPHWSKVDLDDNLRRVGTDIVVRELEALMIKSFGLSRQNQMRFLEGQKWEQATWEDCYPTGILSRVGDLVLTPTLRDALDQFNPDAR